MVKGSSPASTSNFKRENKCAKYSTAEKAALIIPCCANVE